MPPFPTDTEGQIDWLRRRYAAFHTEIAAELKQAVDDGVLDASMARSLITIGFGPSTIDEIEALLGAAP